MFLVLCSSPLDENWEERDERIFQAAGRRSNERGASGGSEDKVGMREHTWFCLELDEAVAMKKRLFKVEGVLVSVREK